MSRALVLACTLSAAAGLRVAAGRPPLVNHRTMSPRMGPADVAYLEENKGKEGVTTLPSGLQYRVLTKGSGTVSPAASTPCACHYEGRLIDGTKFDSSYDRGAPTTFAPKQVIAGWTEAMQLMVAGDKWEMVIPSNLAYGERGMPPNIPPAATLVFTMEIVSFDEAAADGGISIPSFDKMTSGKFDFKPPDMGAAMEPKRLASFAAFVVVMGLLSQVPDF